MSSNISPLGAYAQPGLTKVQDAERGPRPVPAAATPSANSSSVSGLSMAVAQALTQDDARLDRVAALQQQIQPGTYAVPAGQVAASLLNSLTLH